MRRVHQRLRDALAVAREAATDGTTDPSGASRELLLYCHGFCVALSRHHRGEDAVLFPELERQHPELAETLRYLRQDHRMVEHLLGSLEAALDGGADPPALLRHLDGIEAVMESHFGYEERQVLSVLESLDLDGAPYDVLGPLA